MMRSAKKRKAAIWVVSTALCIGAGYASLGQLPPPHPPTRRHTTTQSRGKPTLVPATQRPTLPNQVSITLQGNMRVIQANGIPDHRTGAFPNRGNPHQISAQQYQYRIPASPQMAGNITPLGMHNFGIAVNGVPFDPGAAEWYLGNRQSLWQYEPLSGAVPLGIDASYAHVQPTGAYHYHGLPWELLKELKIDENQHSPLVGWAADGFPIYALYGYNNPQDPNSRIQKLSASYSLKKGKRPSGQGQPGGRYDGTFVADYEYVKESGDLDECNGRFTVTPEFPEGTYAYFLSENWPVIPRNYRGTPSQDFLRRGPGPGQGPGPRPPRPPRPGF